ncbi:MAG: hypothetical protein A3G18_01805 [Rhodospirillales bacterium RIFCSPLOWO2_12_FULL_58_28]|nr:MAG: hypothetical protein A3H92_07710 [Rhodospirillales bacterium RIFCSPLOWO2_02_FULL_58_16]OHC79031.1 MAG: hypothetical protein A3G18_01805 [Rhodospirillales bacterium RIFCSPLOWO2_12_FULL_58_28]
MKWLLVIVLASSAGDIGHEPVLFKTRSECVAAAEAFVGKYPAFELRDNQTVEAPVIRSYVECVPETSD